MKFIIKNIAGTDIVCSELKTFQYKELLKTIYGDEPSQEIFYLTIKEIFLQNTNKDENFFGSLNAFDLLYFIIQLRSYCFGDNFSVCIYKEEIKNTIDINLIEFEKDTRKLEKDLFNFEVVQDNLKLICKSPRLKKLLKNTQSEDHLNFLDGLEINNNQKIKLIDFDDAENTKKVFNALPYNLTLEYNLKFKESLKKLYEYNYLKRFHIEDYYLRFVPNIEYVIWLTKLLFNESLYTLYDNLFYLSQAVHISPDYIEKCTVGEYVVFTKNLEKMLNQRKQSVTEDEHSSFHLEEDNFSF